MKRHGMHILQAIWPIGLAAAAMARERKRALDHWEKTGTVLAPGTAPPQSQEEGHLHNLIGAWEAEQWQNQQRDFLSW